MGTEHAGASLEIEEAPGEILAHVLDKTALPYRIVALAQMPAPQPADVCRSIGNRGAGFATSQLGYC